MHNLPYKLKWVYEVENENKQCNRVSSIYTAMEKYVTYSFLHIFVKISACRVNICYLLFLFPRRVVVRVKEYYLFSLAIGFRKEKISAGCFSMDPFLIRQYRFSFFREKWLLIWQNI